MSSELRAPQEEDISEIVRLTSVHSPEPAGEDGVRRAGLGVDAESLTGAHKLYESAGMHVAARFDVYERAVG